MNAVPPDAADDRVSRRRYEREKRARADAEALLENKTRALYLANEALRDQARHLAEEVHRRTADLEAAKIQAENANEAKSAFLAMISHEIRTPLNGLLGMAAALGETGLNDEQADMAGLLQSSGDTLLSLLNDILDLSKIEARQMEVETIAFDLRGLVEELHQLFALRARDKGIGLDLRIEPDLRPRVLGDPTRVRQVISNLLSNAVKFTEQGEVTISLWQDGDLAQCCIADTGPGIPAAQRDQLFRPFAQTDLSITRKFGGTGLGLAIAREMCRLMGGDLVHYPGAMGGAEFLASFEAPKAEETAQTREVEHFEYELVLTNRPWRVLVAEDNRTNQEVLRLMLRRYELDMIVVSDGAAAVAAHCSNPFDIVLMDVNMPEMNGLEAASFIRQFENARDLHRVPIIALTANAMTHQVQEYLRQGIDAHVAKPVKREVLARAMARLLCQSTRKGARLDQALCAPSASDFTKAST